MIQDLRAISGAVVGAVAVGCNHGASRCPDRTADDGTVSAADRAADRGACASAEKGAPHGIVGDCAA